MRGFWNDPDGISITDFLALLFSAVYLCLIGLLVARMIGGVLVDQDVDFLQIVTWPVLTILGGYFGGQMLGRLQGGLKHQPGPDPQQTYGGYGYGATSYAGYGAGYPLQMVDPRLPAQAVLTVEDMERDPGEVGLSG